jgi:hypothetical protein
MAEVDSRKASCGPRSPEAPGLKTLYCGVPLLAAPRSPDPPGHREETGPDPCSGAGGGGGLQPEAGEAEAGEAEQEQPAKRQGLHRSAWARASTGQAWAAGVDLAASCEEGSSEEEGGAGGSTIQPRAGSCQLPAIQFSCRSSCKDGVESDLEVTSDSSSLCSVSGVSHRLIHGAQQCGQA